MPSGTPYHSFIPPYPIRVDEFADPYSPDFTHPSLHLLTHVHTDHTNGLAAKSFNSRVVCSIDTKKMLLNAEECNDRIAFDEGLIAQRVRPFGQLCTIRPGAETSLGSRDLLCALPLHEPTEFELEDKERVTITLIDANHCPGSVMFLVEGKKGAVLHTGDIRAEASMISDLARNPFLEKYLANPDPPSSSLASSNGPLQTLQAIYLDTACMMASHEVLPKSEAVSDLMKLMVMFPSSSRFYVNSWTWGFEAILKGIARTFNTLIHVDRYKHDIYAKLSDPFMKSILTTDPDATRFHACERHNRCFRSVNSTPNLVYVNPVTMSRERWTDYLADIKPRLAKGEFPSLLLVPLSRHSPLPELQAFVSVFRPKSVVPNFLTTSLQGMDWACMPAMFETHSAPGAVERMQKAIEQVHPGIKQLLVKAEELLPPLPPSVEDENLVGPSALEEVHKWNSSPQASLGRRKERQLLCISKFLGCEAAEKVQGTMQTQQKATVSKTRYHQDDSSDDDDEDIRAQTAEKIFSFVRVMATQDLNIPSDDSTCGTSNHTAKEAAHHYTSASVTLKRSATISVCSSPSSPSKTPKKSDRSILTRNPTSPSLQLQLASAKLNVSALTRSTMSLPFIDLTQDRKRSLTADSPRKRRKTATQASLS
ncbi:hypothetical protein SISSUDRAFT_996763 [Sistotremastrum suecicum HHB10207 ss-3]|uniref:Protein artemis n=1 Tax=Sistotremastrum suecicum HHB10207 ss-3 TaxID=1314776 RepID=A0A166IIL3_9AGAM|nr:hypothetical protein SISSUDRAFT_996763 [Sistotremastrum suecicum HHB10207 ss-3]